MGRTRARWQRPPGRGGVPELAAGTVVACGARGGGGARDEQRRRGSGDGAGKPMKQRGRPVATARELSSDARTASSAAAGAGRAHLCSGRASEPVVSLDPNETEEYGTRLGRERG